MKTCLVTKHNGVSSDNSLLKVGELKFNTEGILELSIKSNEPVEARIVGDGYFTDDSGSNNNGVYLQNISNSIIYVKGVCSLFISNKYGISFIKKVSENYTYLDINSLRYCTLLTGLYLNNTNITGDISALKNMTLLVGLSLNNTNITGDISALKNMTMLCTLYLNNTNITGDISALKNMTMLTTVILNEVSTIYGNLGDLPDSINLFSCNKSKFTWTGTTRKYILPISNVYCDNIDKMLQDMSLLEINPKGTKVISLKGNRTVSSDAAIATLQEKGYTVTVTPA